MTVAAIPNQVDDDVGGKGMTVVCRQSGHPHDCLRVFRIDVEDGDGQALGQVGGEA